MIRVYFLSLCIGGCCGFVTMDWPLWVGSSGLAKSLDRDLGDVHHSHYLMRQCDGVGGWVRLKYSCEGVGAKCAAGAKQRSDEKRDWRLYPL